MFRNFNKFYGIGCSRKTGYSDRCPSGGESGGDGSGRLRRSFVGRFARWFAAAGLIGCVAACEPNNGNDTNPNKGRRDVPGEVAGSNFTTTGEVKKLSGNSVGQKQSFLSPVEVPFVRHLQECVTNPSARSPHFIQKGLKTALVYVINEGFRPQIITGTTEIEFCPGNPGPHNELPITFTDPQPAPTARFKDGTPIMHQDSLYYFFILGDGDVRLGRVEETEDGFRIEDAKRLNVASDIYRSNVSVIWYNFGTEEYPSRRVAPVVSDGDYPYSVFVCDLDSPPETPTCNTPLGVDFPNTGLPNQPNPDGIIVAASNGIIYWGTNLDSLLSYENVLFVELEGVENLSRLQFPRQAFTNFITFVSGASGEEKIWISRSTCGDGACQYWEAGDPRCTIDCPYVVEEADIPIYDVPDTYGDVNELAEELTGDAVDTDEDEDEVEVEVEIGDEVSDADGGSADITGDVNHDNTGFPEAGDTTCTDADSVLPADFSYITRDILEVLRELDGVSADPEVVDISTPYSKNDESTGFEAEVDAGADAGAGAGADAGAGAGADEAGDIKKDLNDPNLLHVTGSTMLDTCGDCQAAPGKIPNPLPTGALLLLAIKAWWARRRRGKKGNT